MSMERKCPQCETLPYEWSVDVRGLWQCHCQCSTFDSSANDLAGAVDQWNRKCLGSLLTGLQDPGYRQALLEVDEWRHRAKERCSTNLDLEALQELKNILRVLLWR
jgi:hypothetical protein